MRCLGDRHLKCKYPINYTTTFVLFTNIAMMNEIHLPDLRKYATDKQMSVTFFEKIL